MTTVMFFKGLLIGLIMCAPVGPIGMICAQRTLAYGAAVGIASVLGAATVDGVYTAIAGFGVKIISDFVVSEEAWLTIIGGVILIALGLRTGFKQSPTPQERPQGKSVVRAYVTAFLFMLANPVPMLMFAAVFAALGLDGREGAYLATGTFVLGVFAGSSLWAPLLVMTLSIFHPQLSPGQLNIVNKIAGAIIAGFGVVVLAVTFF
jgi:threonine/homoserine/homoserine lactone efflux protein